MMPGPFSPSTWAKRPGHDAFPDVLHGARLHVVPSSHGRGRWPAPHADHRRPPVHRASRLWRRGPHRRFAVVNRALWPVSPSVWSPSVGRVSWSHLRFLWASHIVATNIFPNKDAPANMLMLTMLGTTLLRPCRSTPPWHGLGLQGQGLHPCCSCSASPGHRLGTTGFRDKPGCSFWVPYRRCRGLRPIIWLLNFFENPSLQRLVPRCGFFTKPKIFGTGNPTPRPGDALRALLVNRFTLALRGHHRRRGPQRRHEHVFWPPDP
ncbi:MAG: hypothetical protein CM15mP18_5160 [Methanobacteriota archaeon]|nr:MAG: hypothetical protein CM15mP18_5160 [Euryarchaeota archaeon]